MFAKFKEKLTGGAARMSGRTDLLEAVCASAALVAMADGSIDDKEIEGTTKAVAANENLRSFDSRTINSTMERMFDRAEGGRVGRAGLMKEIRDIAANAEEAEVVLLTALDISESDGNMDDAEKAVLGKIAAELNLKLETYL